MRIAKVIGKVTLSKSHPSYVGARLRVTVPLSFEEVVDGTEPTGEWLVVWDELGSGHGDLLAVAEGPEASQAFRPAEKAVDAYAAALIDELSIDRQAAARIRRE